MEWVEPSNLRLGPSSGPINFIPQYSCIKVVQTSSPRRDSLRLASFLPSTLLSPTDRNFALGSRMAEKDLVPAVRLFNKWTFEECSVSTFFFKSIIFFDIWIVFVTCCFDLKCVLIPENVQLEYERCYHMNMRNNRLRFV